MRILKKSGLILLLVLTGLIPACQSPAPSGSSAPPDLSELTQPAYLQMVMRYLYRWQLDESEFEELFAHKSSPPHEPGRACSSAMDTSCW